MRPFDILYIGGLPRGPAVEDALHVGGMGSVAATLLRGLAQRGHAVRSLSAVARDDTGSRFLDLGDRVETLTYEIERPLHDPTNAEYFRLHGHHIRELVPGLVDRRRPDLVLVGHQSYAEAFPDVLQHSAVPWLLWIHTTLRPAMVFGDGVVDEALAERMYAGMRAASGLVVVADHIAADLAALEAGPAVAIPNAADASLFIPRTDKAKMRHMLGLPEHDPVVVHASNLKPTKRVADVIEAIATARDGGRVVSGVIIGEGPVRRDLENLVRARGLEGFVQFTGWLPQCQVADYLGVADIAVYPSAAEGISLALLEALASGCAVVASDIPAVREVVEPGVSALTVPVGDATALGGALLSLIDDPERCAGLAKRGRQRVRDEFTVEAMVARFEGAFERLLRDGRL